jgi:hypothetical protein
VRAASGSDAPTLSSVSSLSWVTGSSATAFTLDSSSTNQGLIQYGIVYNPTTFAYSLVTAPGAGVYRTALFNEGARNLWLQSGDAWSGHMRELRDSVAANGDGSSVGRVWAQVVGQLEKRGDCRNVTFNGITTPMNMGYKQDYFGGQMGNPILGKASSPS